MNISYQNGGGRKRAEDGQVLLRTMFQMNFLDKRKKSIVPTK